MIKIVIITEMKFKKDGIRFNEVKNLYREFVIRIQSKLKVERVSAK